MDNKSSILPLEDDRGNVVGMFSTKEEKAAFERRHSQVIFEMVVSCKDCGKNGGDGSDDDGGEGPDEMDAEDGVESYDESGGEDNGEGGGDSNDYAV